MLNNFRVQDFGRVAVLYGGISSEREISIKSGLCVLHALQEAGVNVFGIDVGQNFIYKLTSERIDRAFIMLHGAFGEDGTIQGLLEYAQIPYTGSGVLASALAMDKLRSKQIWQSLGLPTPAYKIITNEKDCFNAVNDLGLPLMLKACSGGSSLGIAKITNTKEIGNALNKVKSFDDLIIAEQFISGTEFTVATLNDEILPTIKLGTNNEFFDFEAKYHSESTLYQIPCGLSKTKQCELDELVLKACKALGVKNLARADVIQDIDENFWLLEVNTVPGMTDHSLVPRAAKAYGLDFKQLALNILASTLKA